MTQPNDPRSDQALLAGWRAGDRDMGSVLYRRYADRIISYFRRNVYSQIDVDDLTQETFLALHKSTTEIENISGYLYRIAFSKFTRYLRDRRGLPSNIGNEEDELAQVSADIIPDPEYFTAQRMEVRLLLRSIRRLPLIHQQVLELSYWEEKRGSEIAEILGISEFTVRRRLHLARRNLVKMVKALAKSDDTFAEDEDTIMDWLARVQGAKEAAISVVAAPLDVLVLTALKEEFDALLQVKSGVLQPWSPRGALQVAVLEGRRGPIRVGAARLTRMGGVDAAVAAERLIEAERPRSLAMCGVCAGHPMDTELGDVVIADRVFQHDAGKSRVGGFEGDLWVSSSHDEWLHVAQDLVGPARTIDLYTAATGEDWKWWFLSRLAEGQDPLQANGLRRYIPDAHRLELLMTLRRDRLVRLQGQRFSLLKAGATALAEHQALRGTLVTRNPFHIHVGPIGSGNAVVADGKIWGRLAKGGARKVLGIEMEAAAIGRVAHAWNLPFAVVKGVMDHADGHKTDHFKTFAARAAAEVLCAFLQKVIHPAAIVSPSAHGKAPSAEAPYSPPTEAQAPVVAQAHTTPTAAATAPATTTPTSESSIADGPPESATTCFIAYSSDTAEAVLPLSERLRREGINAWLDRNVTEPPEGWFAWTRQQLVRADFVLVVCSAAFRRRFEAAGVAGTTEGLLAAQLGFSGGAPRGRWIPVLLTGARVDDVPVALTTSTLYQLPQQHDELLRRLAPGAGRHSLPPLPIMSSGSPAELRDPPATHVDVALRAPSAAIRMLTEFFATRFEPEELRQLAIFHGGPELDAVLPGPVASRALLAHELVQKLWQRGLIDSDLFADLLRLRSVFAAQLLRLCEAFGVIPPPFASSVMPRVACEPAAQTAPSLADDDERPWTDVECLALEDLLLPVLCRAPKLSAALDLRLKDIPPRGAPVAELSLRVVRRVFALGRGLRAAQRLARECCETIHGEEAAAADERSAVRELMLKWLPRGYGGGRVYLLSAQPLSNRVPAGPVSLNVEIETVSPMIAEVHVAHLDNRHARVKTRAVILDGQRRDIIEGQGRLPIRTSGSEILSSTGISSAIVQSVYRRYTVEPRKSEKHRFRQVLAELSTQTEVERLRHYVVFDGDDRQAAHFQDIVKDLNDEFKEHLRVVALASETDELPPHIDGEALLLRYLDRILRDQAEDEEGLSN